MSPPADTAGDCQPRGALGVKQPRAMSWVESTTNVVIGYAIAVLTQVLVFPLFGLQASLRENLAIGGVFAAVSIFRSYTVRRLFEGIRMRSCCQTARGDSDRLTAGKGMRNSMHLNI